MSIFNSVDEFLFSRKEIVTLSVILAIVINVGVRAVKRKLNEASTNVSVRYGYNVNRGL